MTAESYMQLALELAKQGQGNTLTNPLVGAVIVKNQQIIGQGYHQQYGAAHAEVNAINSVVDKSQLVGAEIYVTLEPCSHFGKTPPCSQQLIKSKFKKVIIAQLDPNPLVAGNGLAQLNKAGIETKLLNDNRASLALNKHYNFFYQQKRPYITLKYASSLDGKASLIKGTRFQLTSAQSLADLYQERANYQAILIGSGTQVIDNPKLTIRNPQAAFPPIRVLLDQRLRIKATANLIQDESCQTFIFTSTAKYQQAQALSRPHLKFFYADNWLLEKVISTLAKEGIQSLFIEGGPQIYQSFINSALVDEVLIYQAPMILGGNSPNIIGDTQQLAQQSLNLSIQSITQLGSDLKIKALVNK